MNCAICYSRDFGVVLDMGEMALAGAFLKPEAFEAERFYPLRLGFCRTCFSVQVIDRVAPQEMFSNYFYRTSTSRTARAHFARYAAELIERFTPRTVIEIGCNDGAMLRSFAGRADRVLGIDPSNAAAEGESIPGVEIWRSYFGEKASRVLPKADLVVANNVFAHVENINDFTLGLRNVLNPGGAFVFECHYLGSVLAGQYDAIYHEHVFYHSLLSLENLFRLWGMQIFDVEPVGLHGGSMRFYACRARERAIEPSVELLRAQELKRGFDREDTYGRLEVAMLDHRRALSELLNRLKRERRTVAGYGASGRANTLLQWCGIDSLAYIVDDCTGKQGFCTPGTHIPIRAPAALAEERPDYVLALAWTYLDEIAPKCLGLPLIAPLPAVEVLAAPALEAA